MIHWIYPVHKFVHLFLHTFSPHFQSSSESVTKWTFFDMIHQDSLITHLLQLKLKVILGTKSLEQKVLGIPRYTVQWITIPALCSYYFMFIKNRICLIPKQNGQTIDCLIMPQRCWRLSDRPILSCSMSYIKLCLSLKQYVLVKIMVIIETQWSLCL